MDLDRYYQDILKGLAGKLDPERFEKCAADLLRGYYPTLVHVPGGSDSGMDGAIADMDSDPLPLVTTTASNVVGNLERNLSSYKNAGWTGRRALLATSQSLSPIQRKNLHEKAAGLDFRLIQIYDRRNLADLLYRSPEWASSLLGLTGSPPALSAVPKTQRPLINQDLVGRDAELTWLLDLESDALLVGQPGMGKTFLLRQLVDSGRALFVVDDDMIKIANGLRSQQPALLIIDDAHLYGDSIPKLLHLRRDTGLDFSIVATSWPSEHARLVDMLSLAGSAVYELPLLSRDELVDVIKGAGLHGPTELLREIVDQAEGRPGLAATLSDLCLRGEISEIVSGEAVMRVLGSSISQVVGAEAIPILGALSLSGDRGMVLRKAAEFFGRDLASVHVMLVKLAAAGVIAETGHKTIAVTPAAFRHALIKDVFFSGGLSLSDAEALMASIDDPSGVARALSGAKARGADIPSNLIRNNLVYAPPESWQHYAWLGPNEAEWVFNNRPDLHISSPNAFLQHIPDKIIPRLLNAAVGDDRPLHSHPEHPLRKLADWVKSGRPDTGDDLRRRVRLIRAVENWLENAMGVSIALLALQIAFSPGFEDISTDPGSGRRVTFRSGYISENSMDELRHRWGQLPSAVFQLLDSDWSPIRELAEEWTYNRVPGVTLDDSVREKKDTFARAVVADLARAFPDRPGVQSWAAQIATTLDVDIDTHTNTSFEVLYPGHRWVDYEEYKAAEEDHIEKVRALAKKLSKNSPRTTAEMLVRFEGEADQAGLTWPRYADSLCRFLAELVLSPQEWAVAFLEQGASPGLVAPLLAAALDREVNDGLPLIGKCLASDRYEALGISFAILRNDIPADTRNQALAASGKALRIVETLSMRAEISEEVLDALLRDSRKEVAAAAAIGHWAADPAGEISASLDGSWRAAILRVTGEEHWLPEIFAKVPDLAYAWLQSRFADPGLELVGNRKAFAAAIAGLTSEEKWRLMEILPDNHYRADLVSMIVGDSITLFRALLDQDLPRYVLLAPLAGDPTQVAWSAKARAALNSGFSPTEVAGAAYGYPLGVVGWTGKASSMWQTWVDRFRKLEAHEGQGLQQVGVAGREIAEARMQNALEYERMEDVYGIGWRKRL